MVNEKLTHGTSYLGSRSNKNKTFYIILHTALYVTAASGSVSQVLK